MKPLLLREVNHTPLTRSLSVLKSLVSPITGIVPFTTPMLPVTDDARLFHVASTTANARELIGAGTNRYSGGIDYTPEGALAAAIGEAAERYAAAYVPEDHMLMASAEELGRAAVDPHAFALFHDSQYDAPGFHFTRFTTSTRVRWTPGYSLPDGAPVFLPTQLVHLLSGDLMDDTPIGYATSSGMACGPTMEEAILSGLLEVIERDAFQLTWYNRLSLPILDMRDDPVLMQLDAEFFAPTGLHYRVIDLSVFLGVPTALGIVRESQGGPAFAAGAASATTMRHAVRKALREAFQTRTFARHLRSDFPDWACADPNQVVDFDEHVLFHAYPGTGFAHSADFVDASTQQVGISEIPSICGSSVTENIRAIVGRLADLGIETYVVNITPPDLLAAGLHAVTVVCPRLCRLDVAYPLRYLGGKRLYHAAHDLGLHARPLTIADLNPDPHPFP